MWNTFKYTLISLLKEKNILIWAIAFPLILATLFNIMFGDLDNSLDFHPIATAVVEDAHYRDAEAFKQMIETLAEPGDDQVLTVTFVGSIDEAERLLEEGSVAGYYMVDKHADPALFVAPASTIGGVETVNQTILKDIQDNFVRSRATLETIAERNPAALADPATIAALYSQKSFTDEIAITANAASGSVRYFYALLGFASIMAATIAMVAVTRTQANLSAIGARRSVGATGRATTLTATLLASWLLSFLCLFLAFCYMRYILGIGFGRDLACIFGLAVSSLMTTALGAFIGSIPKLGEGAKSGILTGLSCLLALFAGLYGTASLKLADELSRTVPLFQLANPSKQVTDLFYSLYFYDGYEQFFTVIIALLIMATILFVFAAIFMRRQRYASL